MHELTGDASGRTYHSRLHECLIRIAGKEPAARTRVLQKYSAFTPPNAEEPIVARSVETMSEKWAKTTLERLLDGVQNGEDHFHFNELGVKVQLDLFK